MRGGSTIFDHPYTYTRTRIIQLDVISIMETFYLTGAIPRGASLPLSWSEMLLVSGSNCRHYSCIRTRTSTSSYSLVVVSK